MWWAFYNGLSKRMANQVTDFLQPEPTPENDDTETAERSSHVDMMVRQISEDIAQMSEAEREAVKAELAYHAREWCLKDLSHDLRTPLNAIIGFTQMMENGVLGPVGNPQYLEYLRHIRESGYELLEKFEDLMDTVEVEKPLPKTSRRPRKAPAKFNEAVA